MTTRCHVVCVVGEQMGAGKGRERGRWRVLLSKMWWRDPSGRRIPSQSSSDRCIAISSCPLRCHVVSTQKSPPPPPPARSNKASRHSCTVHARSGKHTP